MDLAKVFDSNSDRLPEVILRLDRVDVAGRFGLNEWSAEVLVGDAPTRIDFGIAEGKALIDLGANITGDHDSIVLASASDFTNLFNSSRSTYIDLTAGVDIDFPIFVTIGAVGFSARVGYVDDDILDDANTNITFASDILFNLTAIREAAHELAIVSESLDVEALREPLPLIDRSLNELIAGKGRKISGLLNLTDWANILGSTTLNNTSPGSPADTSSTGPGGGLITKTELLKEVRKAVQGTFGDVDPSDVNLTDIPTLPDVRSFQPENSIVFATAIGHSPGGFCNGTDKAISVSIDGNEDNFTIIICSLLGFDDEKIWILQLYSI